MRDFDGNHVLDSSRSSSPSLQKLYVLLGNGNGTFAAHYAQVLSGPTSAAQAGLVIDDVDHDNDSDLLLPQLPGPGDADDLHGAAERRRRQLPDEHLGSGSLVVNGSVTAFGSSDDVQGYALVGSGGECAIGADDADAQAVPCATSSFAVHPFLDGDGTLDLVAGVRLASADPRFF